MAWATKKPRNPRGKKCFLDKLSPLPDYTLHRILSYLDFVDVVRTSVLSKRWRTVWMSVPCLNFNKNRFMEHNSGALHQSLEPRHRFWDFIKQALLVRNGCPIRRISISSDDTMVDQLNGLLRAAVEHKVHEICFLDGDHAAQELEFPQEICETLTSLTIDFLDDIPLRAETVFSSLKSLYLGGVVISRDTAEKLLSSDSVCLQNVHLEGCQFKDLELVNISGNNIQNLTIVNMDCFGSTWMVGTFNFSLHVSAPNLVSFSYIGPMLGSFALSNAISMRHALIRVMKVPASRSYGDGISNKNLSACPTRFIGLDHAKVLTMSSLVVKHLSPSFGNFNPGNFILDHLNCLKLGLRYNVDCIEGLINLLRLTPNLEALVIRFREVSWHSPFKRNTKRAPERRGTWKSRVEDIACLSYNIKSIEISGFDGSEIALGLVKFLLQNGKVLKKVEIMCRSKESKKKVSSRLVAALSRDFPKVVISFPVYTLREFPWFHIGDSDPEED